ncbi:HlyD family efflux transporter periplasmic adaptor subunit [Pseudomonas citronellolis]|uniref:HlyD family efflux transporter periplasmic adaptor subunit n=1 Tax=Pseudomonas citronellolis TaxID=53408 RepID=UPI0023E397AA|nr:HlyD family efflux transporter periplasmic adaptor subunit [Pseudomonas citronellolis]MDF3934328.1 HlyD family efflux transporter periplasmic adaptor subunit [Pseudomonas citronellolis]
MMKAALPSLRQELSVTPGPRLADGQPSWTLHDPARNQFFQLDWAGFEILSRWHLGDAGAILDDINRSSALQLDEQAFDEVLQFLRDQQLFVPASGSAALLAAARARQRGTRWQWLLHNYLFFRIPLLRPDRLLDWLLPHLAFLFSAGFRRLTLAAGALGLIGAYRDWDRFSATLMDNLSWDGALMFGLTVIFAKTCHELGHALTAKRYGCRVPTMGLAFLVLWPVAYTDTNEVWKLPRRQQRLAVAGAGIATELSLAAWATLAWSLLPEGGLRQAAFLLSTTTWISTLLINASPFMRFDGYFILSDYLGLPNLHQRSFALARWDLRERLFKLGEPAPEAFPRQRRAGLILFAWAVWIYRLVLFLGIAALVYHFFIKAVGILLFIVEMGWFVALPIWRELQAWGERWPTLKQRPRARLSLALLVCLVALCVVPWPDRIRGTGMLQPQTRMALYAPVRAQVTALPVADGQHVAAGQPLLELQSPELVLHGNEVEARHATLAWQSAAAGFDSGTRKDWQVLNDQLAYSQAEQTAVSADAQRYSPTAPYSGVLVDVDPDLRPGQWLSEREYLGSLVADGPWQVVTYVDEEVVHRIAPGDPALFIADGLGEPAMRLTVHSIDRDAARTLGEPELSNLFGGNVLAREKSGVFYPEHAVYRVVLQVRQSLPATHGEWRGHVTIAGRWEIPSLRFLRAAAAVLWRESGF